MSRTELLSVDRATEILSKHFGGERFAVFRNGDALLIEAEGTNYRIIVAVKGPWRFFVSKRHDEHDHTAKTFDKAVMRVVRLIKKDTRNKNG